MLGRTWNLMKVVINNVTDYRYHDTTPYHLRLTYVSPFFSYALVSPFVLLYAPSLCIYRHFRATFTIKAFIQFSHTAKLTNNNT